MAIKGRYAPDGTVTLWDDVTGTTALTITPAGAVTLSGVVTLSNASINITALPTADPHVVGQLYTASGAIKVSAG